MLAMLALVTTACYGAKRNKQPKETDLSPIDRLLADTSSNGPDSRPSAGSLYASDGNLADMGMDYRAARVGDIVTVVVAEQATANAQGVTSTKRASSAKASVNSLFGPKSAASALTNLADLNGQQQLDGQGSTSRQTSLSTTVSARVLKVLPNGNLIVEATKLVAVNSDTQTVSLRGIIRPIDIGPDNSISSNRLAYLEVRMNGRGVITDAIHRPNIIYRLLLGILPF
jgi:flagellar L-ring protein precursor FlgH